MLDETVLAHAAAQEDHPGLDVAEKSVAVNTEDSSHGFYPWAKLLVVSMGPHLTSTLP
ncbi:MAG: hypothetical protein N3E40_00105 [Dehalococcoidia bacterium]|nr:hypothetical protein [Dehalococcoidia bacterium]